MSWDIILKSRLYHLTNNKAEFTNCFDAGGYMAGDFYLHYGTKITRIHKEDGQLTDMELMKDIIMPLIDSNIENKTISTSKTNKVVIDVTDSDNLKRSYIDACKIARRHVKDNNLEIHNITVKYISDIIKIARKQKFEF